MITTKTTLDTRAPGQAKVNMSDRMFDEHEKMKEFAWILKG